jgi:excinuclease UvrABC helicase subunit UvrB
MIDEWVHQTDEIIITLVVNGRTFKVSNMAEYKVMLETLQRKAKLPRHTLNRQLRKIQYDLPDPELHDYLTMDWLERSKVAV